MGEVVQLRPDPDQALADVWNALIRAHQIAVAQPTIRNMVRVARAYEVWVMLAVSDEAARRELLQ